MTGARFFGAAYPNDPTIEADLRTEQGIAKYPHVCVWLTRTDERTPMHSAGGDQAFLTPHVFKITGWTERTDVPAITWAMRLSEDVELTLQGAYELGGLSSGELLFGQVSFDPEVDVSVGVAQIAKFEVEVTARLGQVITMAP
jgi:hypothetical protein